MLGQPSPNSAGLLGAEIEGQVFLSLVEDPKLLTLGSIDDGQNASDGLANIVARFLISFKVRRHDSVL